MCIILQFLSKTDEAGGGAYCISMLLLLYDHTHLLLVLLQIIKSVLSDYVRLLLSLYSVQLQREICVKTITIVQTTFTKETFRTESNLSDMALIPNKELIKEYAIFIISRTFCIVTGGWGLIIIIIVIIIYCFPDHAYCCLFVFRRFQNLMIILHHGHFICFLSIKLTQLEQCYKDVTRYN